MKVFILAFTLEGAVIYIYYSMSFYFAKKKFFVAIRATL